MAWPAGFLHPTARETRTIKIIPREGWGARPVTKAYIPQIPKLITIHHTAGPYREGDDPKKQLYSIQTEHMLGQDTRWPDIAYHYLIDHHGNIYQGRPDTARGDTRTGYNLQDHVLVCLMGNFEEQRPTPEHFSALTDLLAYLMQKYNLPLEKVHTHGELAKTLCPGKYLIEEWKKGKIPAEAKARAEKYSYRVAQ